jgi:recombination protein RecT
VSNSSLQSCKFSVKINSEGYKKLILNTLGDERRASRFVSGIVSAVSANPDIQNCDSGTILSAGLLGETLRLSPSPQLGHYYIVPYREKACFQLGYKGLIQLAIRSGAYKRINVFAVKEGEFKKYNPLDETIDIEFIQDPEKREVAKTIGYAAMFEMNSGFKKTIYWSKAKMENHAKKYTKCYSKFWAIHFDKMAMKTMIKQLIGTWGLMSEELNTAICADNSSAREEREREREKEEERKKNERQEFLEFSEDQEDLEKSKDSKKSEVSKDSGTKKKDEENKENEKEDKENKKEKEQETEVKLSDI